MGPTTVVVLSILTIVTIISLQHCVYANNISSLSVFQSQRRRRRFGPITGGHRLKLRAKRVVEPRTSLSLSTPLEQILSSVRGGGGGVTGTDTDTGTGTTTRIKRNKKVSSSKKKKKKTKRKMKKSSSSLTEEVEMDTAESSKSAIKEALKEDAASSMGDAIRARSSDLLQDDLTHIPINHNDMTLNSISYAIGSSEQQLQKLLRNKQTKKQQRQRGETKEQHQHQRRQSKHSIEMHNDGGGVEPSSSAVIANYFLKSHGGLHGIQSIMSLLSVFFGIATFAVRIPVVSSSTATTSTNTIASTIAPNIHTINKRINLQIRLLQRTLLCALSKHLSGFIAASIASASRLPDIGWREMNRNIKSFALDPVAQYLFYCAVLILWSNGVSSTSPRLVTGASAGAAKNTAAAVASTATATGGATMVVPWWLKDKRNLYCISCLIGPILIREIVSTIWVIIDVLVLYDSSTTVLHRQQDGNLKTSSRQILSIGKSTIDIAMSLLLTPSQWRDANPAQKQKQLAKLVARVSLLLEIGTGLILIIDAVRAFLDFSVSAVHSRPSWIGVAKRLVCARLYINFMIVRRKKVINLVSDLRGGFVVHRVLDILDKPKEAMGLHWGIPENNDENGDAKTTPKSWKEWISFLLDF